MTKDWRTVRADICRYYSEGKSLTDVKRLLEEERKFFASIRAYRLKIAEWQVKRPRVFSKGLQVATSRGIRRRERQGRIIISLISDDERSPSPTRRVEAGPARSPVEGSPTHGRADLSCACKCKAEDLEAQVQRLSTSLKAAAPISWPTTALQDSAFVDGVDNILHFATRRPGTPSALYARLVYDIASKHLDINARDCNGMTALEIATRKVDYKLVRVLRRAGASRSLCSVPDGTLLHISMMHCPSPSTTRELLSIFFTNGETGVYADSLEESLGFVTEILKTVRQSAPLLEGYEWLHHILMSDHNDGISSRNATLAFKTVIQTWEDNTQVISTETMAQIALPCCALLLKRDADIFDVPDGPIRGCSGRHKLDMDPEVCTTLADLILFHHCEPKLAISVIENYIGLHSERLAYSVMAPCPSRIATSNVDRLLKPLGTLLAKGPHMWHDLFFFALETTPDALKLDVAKAIVSARQSPHIFRSELDTWEAIARLVDIEESIRWTICEAVLPGDPGFALLSRDGAPFALSQALETLPQLESTTAYLDHLCITIKHHLDKGSETSVWSSLYDSHGSSPFTWDDVRWRQENGDNGAYEFQRCAIHVITKMMLQPGDALADELPKKLKIRWALQLRRDFRLPDLVIDSSLLLDVLAPL